MSSVEVHLSDLPDRLGSGAFHLQLRRLSSLQTLMTQGGAVVSEVAQFVVKAREELTAFQREQESYVHVQQHVLEEKAQLLLRVSDLEKRLEEGDMREREQEVHLRALREQLASHDATSRAHAEQDAKRATSEESLALAQAKVARLEAELCAQREQQRRETHQLKQEQLAHHTSEIALLKNRLAAVEQQLETERERRTRLMEVVKAHDVRVTMATAPKNERAHAP